MEVVDARNVVIVIKIIITEINYANSNRNNFNINSNHPHTG